MTQRSHNVANKKRPKGGSVRPASVNAPARLGKSLAKGRVEKDRVEEFLTVALNLFAKRNFATVTIKDIAEALDVNSALLYYYFEDKTDLFRATIEHAVSIAFDTMCVFEDNPADPERLLIAWLDNHVERFAEIHRFVKIALDFRSSQERDASVEAVIASFYAREQQLLSKLIRQGIKLGRFRPVNAVRTAQFISTHLDGCMVRAVIIPEFDLATTVGELKRRALAMLSN